MQCAVCGDSATCRNFGVLTCEGCKLFYRRQIRKANQNLRCAFNSYCIINKSTRKSCPSCRLQKCYQAGMKRPLVMRRNRTHTSRHQAQRDRNARESATEQQQQSFAGRVFGVTSFHSAKPHNCQQEASASVNALGRRDSGCSTVPKTDANEEFETVTGHLQQIFECLTQPFATFEAGEEALWSSADSALLKFTETALRRYVRSLKRLPDFASLPHRSQEFVLRKNLMNQFVFCSLLKVNGECDAWMNFHADGKRSESKFAQLLACRVDHTTCNLQEFVDRYTQFVKAVRTCLPDDWQFVSITLSVLACFSKHHTDPNEANMALRVAKSSDFAS